MAQRVAPDTIFFLITFVQTFWCCEKSVLICMWDNVKASEDWLKEQVPPVVHTIWRWLSPLGTKIIVLTWYHKRMRMLLRERASVLLKYAGTAAQSIYWLPKYVTLRCCEKNLATGIDQIDAPETAGYLRISTSNGHGRYRRTKHWDCSVNYGWRP